MNNWIPKNKIVEFAATIALFSVILYSIGLLIVFREIKKIEDFYRNTESESSKEERFLTIKSIAEANSESIQALRDFFVRKGDEVKFIEQIEGVARASGIKFEISSIDVKANQEDLFKEDVDVKISVEGSWKDIVYLINKLEKMSFGVLINEINLDANIVGSWIGSIDLVLFREK